MNNKISYGMKKDLINTLKILIVATILSFGISVAYAQWVAPAVAPPAGNVSTPVNIGNTDQVKSAGLGVTNFIANSITLGSVTRSSWPGDLPVGAVMPFDLASCPSGWSSYNSAQNRTIVGSGGSYGRGTTGGLSTVTLTVNEMPSHSHAIDNELGFGSGSVDYGTYQSNRNQSGILGYTQNTGGGQSHNNMQPYLALLYCVKN